MQEQEHINIAQTAAALATAGLDTRIIENAPFVLIPPGYTLSSLENLLPRPNRITTNPTFVSLESFIRYVNEFKDQSRIFISPGGNALAMLDAHTKEGPAWQSHSATFKVTYSDRWTRWDQAARKTMTQRQFAEFVEDNLGDFLSPNGGTMLDISKTLQAEQNSTFKSGIRLENGDVQLTYEKTTVSRAGQKGEMEIPSQFSISIPILENEPPRPVEVRLRYELQEGKLVLTYEILRRTALLEEVRRSIYAIIKNETGIEPFLVS